MSTSHVSSDPNSAYLLYKYIEAMMIPTCMVHVKGSRLLLPMCSHCQMEHPYVQIRNISSFTGSIFQFFHLEGLVGVYFPWTLVRKNIFPPYESSVRWGRPCLEHNGPYRDLRFRIQGRQVSTTHGENLRPAIWKDDLLTTCLFLTLW